MQAAVPAGEGAMAAILGLSPSDVAEVCKKAAGEEVVTPGEPEFSRSNCYFRPRRRREARRRNRLADWRQARRDACRLRAVSLRADEARAGLLRKRFARHEIFTALRFPVITNADAEAITTGDEAREALIRQVTPPVRWLESVREMIDQGVTFSSRSARAKSFGTLRQIDRSVRCFNVEDSASLQAALDKVAQARAEAADA